MARCKGCTRPSLAKTYAVENNALIQLAVVLKGCSVQCKNPRVVVAVRMSHRMSAGGKRMKQVPDEDDGHDDGEKGGQAKHNGG